MFGENIGLQIPEGSYYKGPKEKLSEFKENFADSFMSCMREFGIYLEQEDIDHIYIEIIEIISKEISHNHRECLILINQADKDPDYPIRCYPLKLSVFSEKILITPQPVVHGITNSHFVGDEDPNDLMSTLKIVLKQGFRGHHSPNVYIPSRRREMGYRITSEGKYSGCSFTIELVAPLLDPHQEKEEFTAFVQNASPNQIKSINVVLPNNSSEENNRQISISIKEELKQYGKPIRFFDHYTKSTKATNQYVIWATPTE